MNLQEAPRLIQHVAWLREVRLIDTRRCTALHRSLGRRLAELVSVASLQVCRDAGGILLVLDPALGSLSIQVSKALEARLAYLLYHPESSGDSGHACTDNLLHLEAHYRCTSEMYRDGVIGLQAHSTVVTHIKGWIVRASVEEMCLHIVSIVALSLEERALEHAVEEKLLKVLPKLDSALQTEHLLALLLQIENLGMTAMCDRLCPVISNWMRLLVEKRSCKILASTCASMVGWQICVIRDNPLLKKFVLVSALNWFVKQRSFSHQSRKQKILLTDERNLMNGLFWCAEHSLLTC